MNITLDEYQLECDECGIICFVQVSHQPEFCPCCGSEAYAVLVDEDFISHFFDKDTE
jgi:Zn finger protein HypA/HybF involved in hydrogenase expression